MSDETIYDENSPLVGNSDIWLQYRKRVPTRAIKIDGPFTVRTSEGPLHCQDGYLAKDARGYPYPIATAEFALSYDKVSDA